MKALYFFLFLALIEQTKSNTFQCTLSVQLSPLEYMMVTRSMSLRLRFASNCMRLRDFVFESFFTFTNRISKDDHPTTLILKVLDNQYTFQFSQKMEKDQNSILRKIIYGEATFVSGSSSSTRDITKENYFILQEQISGSFTLNTLRSLLYKDNPRRCKFKNGNKTMECELK